MGDYSALAKRIHDYAERLDDETLERMLEKARERIEHKKSKKAPEPHSVACEDKLY